MQMTAVYSCIRILAEAVEAGLPDGIQSRLMELQDFIAGQETNITGGGDETLVKKLIEKITVFADHFILEFKSGVEVNIER